MNRLQAERLVYVATPYSKYKDGDIHGAFMQASSITADLLRQGVKCYSPIAHTHPIAIYGGINPLDHSIWLPFDQAIMDAASSLCVAMMEGWRESYGVGEEIKIFKAANKPIYYLDVDVKDFSVFDEPPG